MKVISHMINTIINLITKRKEKSTLRELIELLKYSIKEFIEVESTTAGKINFLFGVFGTLVTSIISIPTTVIYVLKAIFPGVQTPMPWYGVLATIALMFIYFYFCATKLIKIETLKK